MFLTVYIDNVKAHLSATSTVKFGNFREGFILAKLRICEVS